MSRLAGNETEVAAITDRAMRGKVEFKQALRQRVALLKGLPLSELEHLILNIPYTPVVERLVYILKTLGYQIGLVSGGFTRVIEHIKQRFNLDYGYANTLEVKNGKLTGRISGDILDGHQKGVILRKIAHRENILPEQVIAVGEGANDLEMLSSAGLGVAFNAKRFLRERASGSLSLTNLDALLNFLWISVVVFLLMFWKVEVQFFTKSSMFIYEICFPRSLYGCLKKSTGFRQSKKSSKYTINS